MDSTIRTAATQDPTPPAEYGSGTADQSLHSVYRFDRDVIPYTAYLLGHAQALTKQQHDAEDLLQDTMMKAYVSFETFQVGSNMKSWLYRIMMNAWVDKFRRTQRRPAEILTGHLDDPEMVRGAVLARNGAKSAELEVMARVPGDAQSALDTLAHDVREAVFFADVEGYRNTEIAEILGIPVGTVASRLHRGRSRLRELLLEEVA